MNFLQFLLRRSKHHWVMLITFIFGVVLATGFLASGPILIDTLLEFGFRKSLIRASQHEDLFHLNAWNSISADEHQLLTDQLNDYLASQFGILKADLVPAARIGYLYPWNAGQISLTRRLTLGFYGNSQAEFIKQVNFVAGKYPHAPEIDFETIPVYIGSLMARDFGLSVGDRVPVSISPGDASPEFILKITGIVEPKSFQNPYWLDTFNPFRTFEQTESSKTFGIFVDRAIFFQLAQRIYPSLSKNFMWQAMLGLDDAHFSSLEVLEDTLLGMRESITSINTTLRVNSTLLTLLDSYKDQSNIVRAPIFFLMGIVILMALYYLIMMASLYLEAVKSEFSVLRSRGSSGIQLFNISIFEGVFFSFIAAFAGPFLAWIAVRILASYGPLRILMEPEWEITLPQAAWLAAGVAAIASITSFLTPLPALLKASITTHFQHKIRVGKPPWWQRTYLDVFALSLGIVLLYRFELYGSFIGGSQEIPRLDLMLIFAPLFLLIGAAAIFLRIFPIILKNFALLASHRRGLPAVLALNQTSRDPSHVTRLVLLLMLAMTLGIFSTSLNATMTKNEVDRSRYFAGSDIRLITDPDWLNQHDLAGIQNQSWIWRSKAALLVGAPEPGLDLLAINPGQFSKLVSLRDDFSDTPVDELLQALQLDWENNKIPLPVKALPGEPVQIGLWFGLPFRLREEPGVPEMISKIQFEARLNTATGQVVTVHLRPVFLPENSEEDWFYFQGNIPILNQNSYPLRMTSLWFQSSGLILENFEPIWLEDIEVIDHINNERTILESFEYPDVQGWHSLTHPMRVFGNESFARTGQAGLAMYFDRIGISPLRWYGMNRINDIALQAIPALASSRFIENTNLEIGETVRIKVKVPGSMEWDRMTFKILGEVNYFPTLFESQEAGFIVTLQEPLFEQANLYRYYPVVGNEILLDTIDEGSTRSELLNSGFISENLLSAQETLTDLRANPLAIGLRSVTWFGYILTTILSLVGFASHFYMSTKKRAGNYSVLRALGFSPAQLYATLLIEQVFLVVSGLALGTILGILLNQLTLPGLPLRLGELDTIPPFVVQIEWGLILQVYGTMVIAFLISIGIAIFLLWRIRIHRALRIGEE